MRKLGGWRVQICGCAGRALKLCPAPVSLHRCHFTRLSFLGASILSLYSIVGLLSFGLLHNLLYYL